MAEKPVQRGSEGLGPSLVPVPFSPDFALGPHWLRAPSARDGAPAAATDAVAVTAEIAEAEQVTARSVAESAMRAVVGIDEAISSMLAMRARLLAGIGQVAVDDALAERLDPGVAVRDAACELGLLGRRSDRTIQAEMSSAMRLVECWPATLAAWGEARIHRGHLYVIEEIGAALQEPAQRAEFEAILLPYAEQTTPGRLRAIARRELERLLPDSLAARHEQARAQRHVGIRDVDDGMSLVQALVPSVLAHGIDDRLTQMARALADDPRSMPALRADLFADLLLTGEPTGHAIEGIRADVTIVIPANVLLDGDGDGDGGGDTGSRAVARLANGAPVDPETARLLAGRTKLWTRLFTDPLKGHVVAVDTYKPSRALRRLLRARDQQCRWPGCTAKAMRCDIDHTRPWAEGGKTEVGNLAHLCRRHHVLKGAQLADGRAWKVEQISPGVLAFTSPMGETYIDRPPPVGPVFREPVSAWGALGVGGQQGELPF